MVDLRIEGDKLVCEVEGWHKVWACKSRLEVPLEHIKAVHVRSEGTKAWWHGWKIVGTDFPGGFAAGIFRLNGKWVFWDVKNPENAVEIELKDDAYERLLMEVEDPDAAAKMIEEQL